MTTAAPTITAAERERTIVEAMREFDARNRTASLQARTVHLDGVVAGVDQAIRLMEKKARAAEMADRDAEPLPETPPARCAGAAA